MRPAWVLISLAALLAPAGCNTLKAVAYYLSPRHIEKAEYIFPPDSKVLIMPDPARPEFDHPVFSLALFDRVEEIFREKKSAAQLISPREVFDLRRRHADFNEWSVQHIGREVGATHVLYVKIVQFQARETRESPIIEPLVVLRTKVIAVEHPASDARVWPTEKDGREYRASRPPQEAGDAGAEDSAIRKLARDVGYLVAQPFFETDLEEKPEVEP